MRKVDYDAKDSYTGGTGNQRAVDDEIKEGYDPNTMEEGFAAADGVRPGTAETGGRIKHPESRDDSRPSRTPASIEDENPGLAD